EHGRRDDSEPALPALEASAPDPDPSPRAPQGHEHDPGQPDPAARGPGDDQRVEQVEQRQGDHRDAGGEREPPHAGTLSRRRGTAACDQCRPASSEADAGAVSAAATASGGEGASPAGPSGSAVTRPGRTTRKEAPPPGRSSTQ